MTKSLEQTYRQMVTEQNRPKEEIVLFEDDDQAIETLKKRISDAKLHHKRCQIQLKIIDNA